MRGVQLDDAMCTIHPAQTASLRRCEWTLCTVIQYKATLPYVLGLGFNPSPKVALAALHVC